MESSTVARYAVFMLVIATLIKFVWYRPLYVPNYMKVLQYSLVNFVYVHFMSLLKYVGHEYQTLIMTFFEID